MATKMNKYQDGGSKVTRAEKQQIRQGVKTRVKALRDVLKDSESSIGPLEALKMRITGNRHVIKEAKNAKKLKIKMGGTKKYQPGGPIAGSAVAPTVGSDSMSEYIKQNSPVGPNAANRPKRGGVTNKSNLNSGDTTPGPMVSPEMLDTQRKKGGPVRKYAAGGVTENTSNESSSQEGCWPGKPGCKYKKSQRVNARRKAGSKAIPIIKKVGSALGTAGAAALAYVKRAPIKKALGIEQKGGATKKMYKTGGMVNANANLKATATAGSKGVKAGVNPKAAASKVAKGRVGGTSVAPKKAIPKAKYGMTMKGKKSC